VCAVECYNCGKAGHVVWTCPALKEQVKWEGGYEKVMGKKLRKDIVAKEAIAVIRDRRKRDREEEEGRHIIQQIKEGQQRMKDDRKMKKKKQNGQCQQSFQHTILLSQRFESHTYIQVKHLHTRHTCTYQTHMYIQVKHLHTSHTCTYKTDMYIQVTHVHTRHTCTYKSHMYIQDTHL